MSWSISTSCEYHYTGASGGDKEGGQMLSQTQSIQADAKLKSIAHRDAVFSTARRVFTLWEEAAGEQHAGPPAQPGTAPIDWARLHVEALGSGALLGAVHVGLALFVGEWQVRLPAPRTAWWCEPFYYFAKFLGWQLAGALAALRIAAVLAATAQVRALACLYYHYSACGSGNSSSGGEEGLRGQTHVRDAGAVDDTLKILVFYVGLLLLSLFWYKVSCHSPRVPSHLKPPTARLQVLMFPVLKGRPLAVGQYGDYGAMGHLPSCPCGGR